MITDCTRRRVLGGLMSIAALAMARPAHAEALDAGTLGLDPASPADQSPLLQKAMDRAASERRPLFLPGGEYRVSGLSIPGGLTIMGHATAILTSATEGPIARISGSADITLDGISFAGAEAGPTENAGLLEVETSAHILIRQCRFIDSGGNGLVLRASAATVENCDFNTHRQAAIFSLDSSGLMIRGNRIAQCSNNGILIWGSGNHNDNSIVTGNDISQIDWRGGGNGQNGNGINVFRANGVIVSDNSIRECAFSAVRLNAANNTQVRGNTCLTSGEVAIFSEFGFSGSLVSDNIVDGAAGGISITNFNDGGHLAIVSGNLVRNIAPRSEVNPDTTPFGIAAEADTAVIGNVVDEVPGVGISAGWGPYLRDVLVADNLVRSTELGIAVSVAEGAGAAQISGNMVSGARRAALVGSAWADIVTSDLAADAARFPQVTITNNRVL